MIAVAHITLISLLLLLPIALIGPLVWYLIRSRNAR